MTSLSITTLLLFFLAFFFAQASHTSNHAVIVSSSRYWFNYRHAANALTVYKLLKDNGFTDDHIILMLADDYASNPRNVAKNRILTAGISGPSLYDEYTEIDYRGHDVTVQNLVNALTGRQESGLPILHTNTNSNILLYWTGHGGDQFFKFQDVEEIMSHHLNKVLWQMHAAKRYNEILFVADTCQAFTLGDKLTAPNVTVIGSSLRDQSSYAHHSDYNVGLSVIERYTYALDTKMRKNASLVNDYWQTTTIQQAMIEPYVYSELVAELGIRDDLAVRKASQVPVGDFFCNVEARRNTNNSFSARLVDLAKTKRITFRDDNDDKSSESLSAKTKNSSFETPAVKEGVSLKSTPETATTMEPTDVSFLISMTLLLSLVVITSRIW